MAPKASQAQHSAARTVAPAARETGSERRPRGVPRLAAALALAVGLLLSLVVASAPAEAATTTRTAAEITYGRAVLREMNAERAAHHLPILIYNDRLRLAARWHNLSMARYNTMSHQLPGEPYFATRITRAGYHWTYAGENIGWNSNMTQAGVVSLEKIMYNEKAPNNGHRLNILSRNYRNVGIDVYLDRAHHKVWLTTDFARS